MSRIRAEHFFEETPPERIISSECEYTIQNSHPAMPDTSITLNDGVMNKLRDRLGIQSARAQRGYFLQNGANMHNDVSLNEFSAQEVLGPKRAAAADISGAILTEEAFSTVQGVKGIYRRSGIKFSPSSVGEIASETKTTTAGYHENYLIPAKLIEEHDLQPALESFLVTKLFAGAGMVGNGYHVFQKAESIGVGIQLGNAKHPTTHGLKPLAVIKGEAISEKSDHDINPLPEWARLEVRFADPGLSRAGRFLAFGAQSLLLRLIEHKAVFDGKLSEAYILNPLGALKRVDKDMSLAAALYTRKGKKYTALDVQEIFADAALLLSEKICLPNDEVEAAFLWRQVIDDLRNCDGNNHNYDPVVDVIDFAAKYKMLCRKLGLNRIHNGNPDAIKADLVWDRVWPQGGAEIWWGRIGLRQNVVSDAAVWTSVYNPPSGTRAGVRGLAIKRREINYAQWTQIIYRNGTTGRIHDPFAEKAERIPSIGKIAA